MPHQMSHIWEEPVLTRSQGQTLVYQMFVEEHNHFASCLLRLMNVAKYLVKPLSNRDRLSDLIRRPDLDPITILVFKDNSPTIVLRGDLQRLTADRAYTHRRNAVNSHRLSIHRAPFLV